MAPVTFGIGPRGYFLPFSRHGGLSPDPNPDAICSSSIEATAAPAS